MSKQHQYALVTGGSGGIGSAVCMALARDGFGVIVHYHRSAEKAEAVAGAIRAEGGRAEVLGFDVSDTDSIAGAMDLWRKQHSEEAYIAVLVNNAGIMRDTLMVWMEPAQWNEVINTNLNSFFHVTTRVLKEMVLHKWGRIINVVSLSGVKGLPGQANYSAAKAGVIGATKALAQEVGKKKITVNAVAPGYIRTDMVKDLDEAALRKLIPVNRFGTPEEVAATVSFLAGDGAAYITGEVININGGLHT